MPDPPAEWLTAKDQDAPEGKRLSDGDSLLQAWVDSAHAKVGVNCNQCHGGEEKALQTGNLASHEKSANTAEKYVFWSNKVSYETCGNCHEQEVSGWLQSRHGMRLDAGLPPMTHLINERLRIRIVSSTPTADC